MRPYRKGQEDYEKRDLTGHIHGIPISFYQRGRQRGDKIERRKLFQTGKCTWRRHGAKEEVTALSDGAGGVVRQRRRRGATVAWTKGPRGGRWSTLKDPAQWTIAEKRELKTQRKKMKRVCCVKIQEEAKSVFSGLLEKEVKKSFSCNLYSEKQTRFLKNLYPPEEVLGKKSF